MLVLLVLFLSAVIETWYTALHRQLNVVHLEPLTRRLNSRLEGRVSYYC